MTDQPPPTTSQRSRMVTWFAGHRIKHTLAVQAKKGREKYGTDLKTWNGRDPFADAWQELADLCQYLAQAEMEASDLIQENARLRARIAEMEAE